MVRRLGPFFCICWLLLRALTLTGCAAELSSSVLRDVRADGSYLSDPAFWSESYMGHNESSRCITSGDPFDVPAYVFAKSETFPPNMINFDPTNAERPADLGRCLWRNHYRPVVKVSKYGQEAFGMYEDAEHIVVANVRQFDTFYVARIPVAKTSHMNMMRVESEMPVLGMRPSHAELRAFFSEKIKLVPQWPLDPAGAIWVDQLVFTGNPVGAEELSRRWGPNNLDGSVLHARGIHTIDSKIKEHFVDFPSKTERQVRLNLDASEREAYIRTYIALANMQRFGRHFLLLSLNCTYTQFETLDAVLGHRYRAARTPFDPKNLLENLERRKLIDHSIVEPNLEEEPRAQELFKIYPRVAP